MKTFKLKKSTARWALVLGFVVVQFIAPIKALALVGAHSFTNESNGDVFLGGDYIELGMSKLGSFGTTWGEPLPAGFYGSPVDDGEDGPRTNIGMSTNPAGFGVAPDLHMDFFLPGSPEERWNVGYTIGDEQFHGTNSLLNGSEEIPDNTVINQSSGNSLKATSEGTFNDRLKTTQVISFDRGDKFFKNEVTLTNVGDTPLNSVRFMRNFDPDNTVDQGGNYDTQNQIIYTNEAGDGKALVLADTSNNSDDPVFLANGSHSPIFYFSADPRARVSTFGFDNTDPYAAEAYDEALPKGTSQAEDQAISITFDVGTLAPSQSETFTYYTSLDSNFAHAVDEITTQSGEDNGPNNGDANNDGTRDSQQANVTSFLNGQTNLYTAVEVPDACSLTDVTSAAEQAGASADPGYDYPAGLINYTANCAEAGYNATVKLYVYGDLGDDFVLRKYNPTTHTYETVSGATITKTTIGGQKVTVVTYDIQDGGPLDADGAANGVIVDPVGPANKLVGAPDTGEGTPTSSNLLPTLFIASGSIGLALAARRANRQIGQIR